MDQDMRRTFMVWCPLYSSETSVREIVQVSVRIPRRHKVFLSRTCIIEPSYRRSVIGLPVLYVVFSDTLETVRKAVITDKRYTFRFVVVGGIVKFS